MNLDCQHESLSAHVLCRNVVTLKNVSTPKCTTAAEAMEVLRQVQNKDLAKSPLCVLLAILSLTP